MPKRRVVITGLGLITPIGIGREEFWPALIQGCSGIKEIKSFDASSYSSNLGAEIPRFRPEDFIDRDKVESLDRACQLSLAAAKLAVKDASLDFGKENRETSGVIIGTTTSTCNSFANYHKIWLNEGFTKVPPSEIKKRSETIPNSISGEFGLGGCSVLLTTSCAAGTYAVGESFALIRNAKAEIMLAGGTDAMQELSHCGFNALRSLAKIRCRPFDRRRDGLVVSEAGCILLLESLEHALNRGAGIWAEIIGYGLSCDASHLTSSDATGQGAAQAIQNALSDAGLKTDAIDYINAHGTGTIINDVMETVAIKKVFGQRAYKIPVSSIKSMLGHSFGAAGAIEAATCALALTHNTIPPTINYEQPDPDCDLDYVPNICRRKELNMALSNSFAFGGVNSALVLSKYRPTKQYA